MPWQIGGKQGDGKTVASGIEIASQEAKNKSTIFHPSIDTGHKAWPGVGPSLQLSQ